MTLLDAVRQLRMEDGASLASVVRSPGALGQILEPEQNVRLLRRALPAALRRGLTGVSDLPSFERKRVVRSGADLLWLANPLGSERAALLVPDLARCFATFRSISGAAPAVGCVLVTRKDDCRKFHVDWVGLRLIITYVGPGTEWVPNDSVHRPALQASWRSLAAINRRIVPDPRRVMVAAAGDVLLLKGESYPGNAGFGAVHRSPPIAESGRVRLLFKLTSLSTTCDDAACTTEHGPASACEVASGQTMPAEAE
jgi:hypothetical protein